MGRTIEIDGEKYLVSEIIAQVVPQQKAFIKMGDIISLKLECNAPRGNTSTFILQLVRTGQNCLILIEPKSGNHFSGVNYDQESQNGYSGTLVDTVIQRETHDDNSSRQVVDVTIIGSFDAVYRRKGAC